MQTSAFRSIEDLLRHFLHDLCVKLSDGNTNCLRQLFDDRFNSFDQLQTNQYCLLLKKNIGPGSKDTGNRILFDRHLIPQRAVDDLHFVSSLRNKYSHQNGRLVFHSNEQLADILIVQRLVRELSKLYGLHDEAKDLLSSLDNLVRDLVAQVAEVEMPERFDTDGEKNVLGQMDREHLKELIAEAFREARPPDSGVQPQASSSDAVSENTTALISDFENQIKSIARKLAPVASLKGRIDNLESALSSQISGLETAIFQIKEDFDGLHGPGQDDSDFEPDDEDDSFETSERLDELAEKLALLQDGLHQHLRTITPTQARDELISLRKRIWKETSSGPSSDGLLRKSMIDNFLYYLPTTPKQGRTGNMKYWLTTVADDQLPYLDDVCSILRRVVN